MRSWTVVSAAVAPLALIGGWTWAQARQPPGFDPLRDTISALAARGAPDRWIMTTGLLVLGLAHLLTAGGLTEARPGGRLLLAVGGIATAAVAALPQPADGHVVAAGIGFLALGLWPAAGALPSRRIGLLGTAGLVLLLGWLALELRGGQLLGLTERFLAGAEALWPLGVVLIVLTGRRRRTQAG